MNAIARVTLKDGATYSIPEAWIMGAIQGYLVRKECVDMQEAFLRAVGHWAEQERMEKTWQRESWLRCGSLL